MRKRIIALILTIGLLLSCLQITTIAADAAVVVAEDCSATQGGYAYVYLRAKNFVNVAALDIAIYYDSSAMSIDYTSNSSFLNSAQVSTNTATSGVIKMSALALNGLNSSNSGSQMMTICFRINSDCPAGDYPIFVTVGDAYDNDMNTTRISGVNGTITVKKASTQSFPIYTSISDTSVKEADEFTLQAYQSSSYKFASADFNIEYNHELLKIKSIELDSQLLVEGAVYSINDSYPGMAIISYASTNGVVPYNLFKVTFEVIANTNAQTNVKIIASDVHDDSLTAYSPYTATSSTIFITEKEVIPDYPDLKLETEQFIVGKPSDIYVVLEGNSQVAAADFAIDYDKNTFSINSVTADSDALSNGAMIVVNSNFTDGQIRFSYIKQNGDFTEDTTLVKISLTPIASPSEHYVLAPTGSDVCDINFKNVNLDYISDSNCIFHSTVVKPTCTEDGYTLFDCACGEFYTTDPAPALGGTHSYGDFVVDVEPTCTEEGSKSRHCSVCGGKTDITSIEANGHSFSEEWTIDIEPTCTEKGSKSRHCSVCDDKTDITSIDANGHSYGDWVLTSEPTCTQEGTANRICSVCGDEQFSFSEKLLDSSTYPESDHDYGNSISKTYNFSYPNAPALKLTFSASTYTETNWDYIYIYDANGDLYGQYTGSALAGVTITLEGNSFSIKLTSDGSVTEYGFSFDSIVALGEEAEIAKPKGHSYEISDISGDHHNHTITYTCSRCGDEKTETSVSSSSCIECMLIIGSERTHIDYDNFLIYTPVQKCSDINKLLSISESATVTVTASYQYGSLQLYGTGTIVTVSDSNNPVVDYTLIVEGDVNGDSVCDVLDCAQVALVANNHKTFDDVYGMAADINMDDVIDISDYQDIVNKTLAS